MDTSNYSHYVTSKWTPVEKEDIFRSHKSQKEQIIQYMKQMSESGSLEQTMNEAENEAQADASVQASNWNLGFSEGNDSSRGPNKRELFNMKLEGRGLQSQVGQNPFLAGENYMNHLDVQESFLRPRNTTTFMPKNTE